MFVMCLNYLASTVIRSHPTFCIQCTIGSFFAVQPGKPGGYVVYELELVTNQVRLIPSLSDLARFLRPQTVLLLREQRFERSSATLTLFSFDKPCTRSSPSLATEK